MNDKKRNISKIHADKGKEIVQRYMLTKEKK
jgi:hypothetical protein